MALLQIMHQIWTESSSFHNLNPHLLLLLPLLLLSIVILFKLTTSVKTNHPPSPPRLPLIGNLHQLGKLPHRSLAALSAKYGPLMLLKLGHAPTLVVSSADMARDMVKNHDTVFSDRPKTTAANILMYGCTDVAFSPHGEYWRQIRKLSVRELLSLNRVHSFQCVREEEVETDIAFSPYGEYWRQTRKISVLELLSLKRVHSFQFVRDQEVEVMMNKIRQGCGISSSGVDLSMMLLGISNNIISRSVLGRKFEEENGTSKFGELSRKFMIQFASFCFGDMFPYLRWMDDVTGLIARLKASFSAVDGLLDEVIEEHRVALESDEFQESDGKDFVYVLLKLQKDGMLGIDLTQDNLKAILMDMFVGGTDTTSTTMEWTMAELMKNPSKMKKVQEEVRRVMGRKQTSRQTMLIKCAT